MFVLEADSAAAPSSVWPLLARPARWHEWAPHIRGARGLGAPEVRTGASGVVLLGGVLPLPARIVAKRHGRSWTWTVGPATLVHRVDPRGDGSRIAIEISAPGPLEAVLRVGYGPLVGVLVRRLARVAESG
jgi:polyketide cyclase/dehydrase/lipid transport protein